MNKFKIVLILLLMIIPATDGFAAIPLLLNYQGNVKENTGVPVNGTGYFKFAIVNQAGDVAYWLNNGTPGDFPSVIQSPPNAVAIPVTDGVFAVKLGDTSLTNMSTLTQSVFDNDSIYLRVWFSTDAVNFEQFANDIQIVSTGFAFKAAVADQVVQGAVNSAAIQDNSITAADIASGGVASDEILDNSVTSTDIADNSITSSDIATGGVGSAEILDGTITNNDISATAAISASKLANGAGGDFVSGPGSTSLTTTDTVITSVTLVAPSSGLVLLNASGYFYFTGGLGQGVCSISTSTTVDTAGSYVVANGDSTIGINFNPFGSTAGYTVSAAGSVTYNLVCKLGTGTVNVIWPKMTAIFVPIRY